MAAVSSPQLDRGISYSYSKDPRPEHHQWFMGDEVRAILFFDLYIRPTVCRLV